MMCEAYAQLCRNSLTVLLSVPNDFVKCAQQQQCKDGLDYGVRLTPCPAPSAQTVDMRNYIS